MTKSSINEQPLPYSESKKSGGAFSNYLEKIVKELSKFPILVIIFLGLIVYFQTIWFEFVNFDDDMLILDNITILSDFTNIGKAFVSDAYFKQGGYYYRPTLSVSLLIDAQIGGANPWIYYLTSMVLHILASISLFLLLIELKFTRNSSLFWSSLFVIHPLVTNAVAWIPARNDLFLGLFGILSLTFFIKYLNTDKIKYLLLHILNLYLVFSSKEIALFLPFVLLIYLFLIQKSKLFTRANILIFLG